MDARSLAKALGPVGRRIANMLSRGVLSAVSASTKMQTLQLKLLAGEVKDGVEHLEPYGYTSHPQVGAEAVAAFFDGDRSHGVVIVVADRRFRLTGLAPGEVALHDDQGQKIHLTRGGIVIDGAGHQITMTNTTKVRFETAQFECTGEVKDRCDSDGRTMSEMRAIYNGHTHPGDSGGTTSTPNQGM